MNGDMGMGYLCLIMMSGAWWGSYDKLSCCFVWKYAQKILVFKGVPFLVIVIRGFTVTLLCTEQHLHSRFDLP